MNIKAYIPNALTCSNLVCGCLGIIEVLEGNLIWAPYLIWLAAFFDFLDGFAARALKVSSPIGGELDSLADMVTFGVLPAMLLFKMIAMATVTAWVPYLAFVVAIFSAIRLAKFNVDTRQTTSFIGLPTPANALFISSFPLILGQSPDALLGGLRYDFIANPYFLISIAFALSFLLVAELPLFALKFKNYTWADNKLKFIFLLVSVVLIFILKFVAIPLIIILYILLSLIKKS